MRSDRRWPVAIVGAGFSGTMAAAQLARKGIASVLIEGGGRAGRGAAYSTTEPVHLLNIPAGAMSAWPDVPDDFARRAGGAAVFAERRDYGAYLRAILDEAVATGCVTLVRGAAVGARRNGEGWSIAIEGSEPIAAKALVLATGNQTPGRLPELDSSGSRLISDPWGPAAGSAIAEVAETGAAVLIVGTGLTMVDLVLSLGSRGHRGAIVALSRRGLIPRGHSTGEPEPVAVDRLPFGSVAALLAWLRSRSAQVGWQAAVDSLRPHSHRLWRSLGLDEQRRFLRHARPWWDVHRHRIAPQVSQALVDSIAAGRLQVVAGRVQSCASAGEMVEVTIRRRSQGGALTGRFAYVFNCTGPLHSIASTRDPLLARLLEEGHARPDQLGIGLAVGTDSRVEGAGRLWAIGPLAKGAFWEIIAVPDIRAQVAVVAGDIARELAE